MSERENNIFFNLDWSIILIYLCLIIFGVLNIYSADFDMGSERFFDFSQSHGRQIIWVGVSILLGTLLLILDARFFSTFAYGFYGLTIVMLIATLFLSREVAGARSWFEIGSFKIQPAELAKFATAIALAKYLNTFEVDLSYLRHRIMAFGIILLPMAIIVLQNDTGSALVFTALILVLFRFGLPAWFLFGPLALGVIFLASLLYDKIILLIVLAVLALAAFWLLKSVKRIILYVLAGFIIAGGTVFGVDYAFNKILLPHQQARINVLLGKEVDLKGAGYNVHQSLIAIGSGGFDGKGYLNGTQTKFNFVPEQNTDFIFCTVGEEHGFIGSSLLIIAFTLLLFRLIWSAEKQKADFTRVYGYGVASIFFVHMAVNIGMTLGLFPVVGIPLPFLSYGGSSIIGFTILLFIYLKLDASEKQFFN